MNAVALKQTMEVCATEMYLHDMQAREIHAKYLLNPDFSRYAFLEYQKKVKHVKARSR